jgi:hypothetical protein
MENAVTSLPTSSRDERASELDLRLEQITVALQQMRNTNQSLHELEERLTGMTADCAGILEKWAKNDERHAAAVLELHSRLSEWNDIERRLLHESTTRIHQFERSVQHEWGALKDRYEAPLEGLEAQAARVTQTCLAAVEEALGGIKRAEGRFGILEEQFRREMSGFTHEVRQAIADLRRDTALPGPREPWSLENVVRLHNELRSDDSAPSAAPMLATAGLAPAGPLATAPARTVAALEAALDAQALVPAASDVPGRFHMATPEPEVPARPAWRHPLVIAAAIALAALAIYGTYLHSQLQAGLLAATERADAAERGVAESRQAATRQISSARRAADERVASATEVAREAQMLATILAAADLQRFDLVYATNGRRAAQVLWSRSQGVSFSAARLAGPPRGRSYQLWLVTPETATSVGTLQVGTDGRTVATFAPPDQLPRPIIGASVTIEPGAGDSRQPKGSVYLRVPAPSAPVASP